MRRIYFLFAVIAIMAGCATVDSNRIDEIGPGIYPETYEQVIKMALDRILFDPESARIGDIAPPVEGKMRRILAHNPYKVQLYDRVWYTSFTINAKNRYGAYVGQKMYSAVFRGGNLVILAEAEDITVY